MRNNHTDEYKKSKDVVDLVFRRIYVIAFNIYAWFWPIRQAFYRHSFAWEDWLLWAFATFGMYYFVLDSKGIFIKSTNKHRE